MYKNDTTEQANQPNNSFEIEAKWEPVSIHTKTSSKIRPIHTEKIQHMTYKEIDPTTPEYEVTIGKLTIPAPIVIPQINKMACTKGTQLCIVYTKFFIRVILNDE